MAYLVRFVHPADAECRELPRRLELEARVEVWEVLEEAPTDEDAPSLVVAGD
jgi:hypothetical protein